MAQGANTISDFLGGGASFIDDLDNLVNNSKYVTNFGEFAI